MTKKRFKLMQDYSMYHTSISTEDWYTPADFKKGYHFCADWDELFIGPNSLEFEACTCHPLKDKRFQNIFYRIRRYFSGKKRS